MRLSLAFVTAASAAQVTPVQKVVQMLSEMVTRGESEKVQEAEMFQAISKTVSKKLLDLGIEIKHQHELVEKYDSQALSASGEADALKQEYTAEIDENIANGDELAKKTEAHSAAKTQFLTEQKDLVESVDALGRAIQVVKAEMGSVPASFLQNLSKTVSSPDLLAYVQQPQAESTAYEFQSDNVVNMLKDLEKDFKKQLFDLQSGASNAAAAFATFKSDLDNQIAQLDKSISDKKAAEAAQRAKFGEASQNRDDSQGALDEAKSVKKDTTIYFALQKKTFAENQKVRGLELDALKQAVEIISGEAVSGGADKHLPKLVQTSLLQTGSKVRSQFLSKGQESSKQQEQKALLMQIADMLNRRNADRLSNKSNALAMVSVEVMTGGPFDKVIGMIEKLLSKLKEEADAEATHHAWCQEELKGTGSDRDQYQQNVDKLNSEIEGLQAKKAKHSENVKELTAEINEINTTVKEATELRNAQNKENTVTIADAVAAQDAVAKAIGILNDFYSKTSLIQQPELKSYSGMSDSSVGVVGLLETVQSDFSLLESDTRAAEAEAAAAYKALMADSKRQLERKKQQVSDNKISIIKTQANVGRKNKALANADKQLTAALRYWDELQPMCAVKHVSYAERVAQRQEEIAALKEAYEVLDAESKE